MIPEGEFKCPLCNTMLQRTVHGTYVDGLDQHVGTCHKDLDQGELMLVDGMTVHLTNQWASRPKPPRDLTR